MIEIDEKYQNSIDSKESESKKAITICICHNNLNRDTLIN